ncbi:MAG: hypothetical protein A3E98_03095 [Candidatus Doudnabacteria bacterium RIFCSPHIGHO2_12_FULL_48_11]|uniref:Uncharacterized protein n=1 Tax=Candidatus Doudnabacteria bacterium RIFCSPHIGHO2_01_FULL_46_24 TaxID=1817825 RepID=A0A1F5NUF1_9BACT|nr:MAG: hypothetical protein A2720_03620 [Candidatus Doudnabacteria bacterium RIFCSPHIGHO2_01_FULL_46_24]OGE96026.1 MAG: hypothetical protein A3E98_03095 [Candidatus Doudnabacteria bacterium RIFCSPHIGHO2_12_FULL_48_11]
MTWPTKKFGPITFDSILKAFDGQHDVKKGSNSWTRNALIAANNQFNGKWSFNTLNKEQLLKIVLPYHTSEHGGIELVPKSGMTIEDTINKIKSIPDYNIRNPDCWKKIVYLKQVPMNPVFLSVSLPSWPDYQDIILLPGEHFIHLDGLHRLIAWGLDDRLDEVTAFIAGL